MKISDTGVAYIYIYIALLRTYIYIYSSIRTYMILSSNRQS